MLVKLGREFALIGGKFISSFFFGITEISVYPSICFFAKFGKSTYSGDL